MARSLILRIVLRFTGYAMLAFAPVVYAEVVPVVSVKSAVTTLSPTQLVNIFLGRESRFPSGTLAMPIDQAEGSEARDEFYNRFAERTPAQLKAHWSKLIFTGKGQPPRQVGSIEKLRKALYNNPHAIGYMQRHEVDGDLRIVEIKGK